MGRRKDILNIINEKLDNIICSKDCEKLNNKFKEIREYIITLINSLYPEKNIDNLYLENLGPDFEIEKLFYYAFVNSYKY